MSPEIARRLEELRADSVSGAVELAVQAIDLALASPEDRTALAREFQFMHPAIVTVANVGRLLDQPGADLTGLRWSLLEGNRQIASHLAGLLRPACRVLTLSNSSTVEAALRAAAHCQVYILESLPGGEGGLLAQKLGATVVPDAVMGRQVSAMDLALVGIDAYDASGAILNKIGTLPLARCCARFGKPFYAAGHSFKRSPTATARLLAAEEAAAEPGVSRFDRTPPELITAIFTEQGRLGSG